MGTLYPAFLKVEGTRCLVVGGGTVAERKVKSLLHAGARVLVVSPRLTGGLRQLAEEGRIDHEEARFEERHLEGVLLAIAATDLPETNTQIARAAKVRGLLVNVVEPPEEGNFLVPSTVTRGPLTIAISTGGLSPALARRIREELEQHFGPEYEQLAELLGSVRDEVGRRLTSQVERGRFYTALVNSLLLEDLRKGRHERATRRVEQILRQVLDREEGSNREEC